MKRSSKTPCVGRCLCVPNSKCGVCSPVRAFLLITQRTGYRLSATGGIHGVWFLIFAQFFPSRSPATERENVERKKEGRKTKKRQVSVCAQTSFKKGGSKSQPTFGPDVQRLLCRSSERAKDECARVYFVCMCVCLCVVRCIGADHRHHRTVRSAMS